METLFRMKKYHIVNLKSKSGIAFYAKDFYNLVLKSEGFELLDKVPLDELLNEIVVDDLVHIEIGVQQCYEIEVLFTLLKKGYKNIYITLHDAPHLKYPLYEFKNKFLNNLSKVFHVYLNNFGLGNKWYRKINKIFVLNHKAENALKNRFSLKNVYYMPHILNPQDVSVPDSNIDVNYDLLFFGFIGKNKGIEYALELHNELQKKQPQSIFYVVGDAIGEEGKLYFDKLKYTYIKNVEYLGFVDKEKLNDVFSKASAVILPFEEYGFIYPTSGSTLDALKRNKILYTTPVNAIPELIKDGYNGFMLKKNLIEDVDLLVESLSNKLLITEMKSNIYDNLRTTYYPDIVKQIYIHYSGS